MLLGIYFKCLILSIASNLIQHGETTQLICRPLWFYLKCKTIPIRQTSPKEQELDSVPEKHKGFYFLWFKKKYIYFKKNSVVSTNSRSRLPAFRPWFCHPLAVWPWFNPMDFSFVMNKMRILFNYLPHSVVGRIKWIHVCSGLRIVLSINLQQILLLFS